MMRKANANMWWIIIGAVIALVVMIILMVMFTSKTKPLEQGLSNCESKGGVCAPQGQCPDSTIKTGVFNCASQADCCLGSPKDCSPGRTDECTGDSQCQTYVSSGKSYCAPVR